MKRFDFAAEVAKQLITVSSAIITVVIGFYEKFFSKDVTIFFLVFADMLVFVVSIVAGILSLGGIVTLVGRQELRDFRSALNPASKLKPRPSQFVHLFGSNAMRMAAWQQGLFALGLLAFLGVAV